MSDFLQRMLHLVRPYRTRLILGLLFGVLFGLTNGALMALIKPVVDLVFTGSVVISDKDSINAVPHLFQPALKYLLDALSRIQGPNSQGGKILVILTLPVVMTVRCLTDYLSTYLTNWAAARTIADLRTRLFDHLQNLPLAFFSKAKTGDLIARVISDTGVLHTVIANSLGNLVKAPITILSIVVLLLANPDTRRLTLISIIILPACIVPISIYARKVRKSARKVQDYVSELSSLMHEVFTGNRIVKAYNLEKTVHARFADAAKRFVGQVMRVVRANEIPSQFTEFLSAIGISMVLIYVSVQTNPISPGILVRFVFSIVVMYKPIKDLTRLHNQIYQAAATSGRVFELLETKTTVVEPSSPLPLKAANAEVRFENVDFDYDDRPALRDINLVIKPGQMVALVGTTGSGKTTITNLLLRFYDPQRGAVRIGGVDIRQAGIKDLRSQIALVSQDILLFNETIRYNIALGRPDATLKEIEAAAKHAFAHDFITEKPQGYETIVGEKGITLSNGQRQRITIARAILRNAPILILDEATSSLDNESERAVQTALEELMQGRTTICIAHRLSTIYKADLIVVLSAGRIVESGTHADLLKEKGVYHRLHELGFNSGVDPAANS